MRRRCQPQLSPVVLAQLVLLTFFLVVVVGASDESSSPTAYLRRAPRAPDPQQLTLASPSSSPPCADPISSAKQQTSVGAYVSSPRYQRPPFAGGGGKHLVAVG